MGNLITYVEQYKEKDFNEMPFNEVDALVFSQLSYCWFPGYNIDQTIGEFAAERAQIMPRLEATKEKDMDLLNVIALGGRFGDLIAHANLERFDEDSEEQFSAVTFDLKNGEYCIAFRGTDSSVVGWKEDFNLSFRNDVQAQKAALRYVESAMAGLTNKFYICGHSKGGNLAVYAAMNLPDELQERISGVYNFDGPGFLSEVYESEKYQKISPLIQKYVPNTAIIGMILEQDNKYQVVKSDAAGLFQHILYSWCIQDDHFEIVGEIDWLANHIKMITDLWLLEIPFEERKQIVDIIFEVINSTGINSFYDLKESPRQKIKTAIQSMGDTTEEERQLIFSALKRLFQISTEELKEYVREERKSQPEKKRRYKIKRRKK